MDNDRTVLDPPPNHQPWTAAQTPGIDIHFVFFASPQLHSRNTSLIQILASCHVETGRGWWKLVGIGWNLKELVRPDQQPKAWIIIVMWKPSILWLEAALTPSKALSASSELSLGDLPAALTEGTRPGPIPISLAMGQAWYLHHVALGQGMYWLQPVQTEPKKSTWLEKQSQCEFCNTCHDFKYPHDLPFLFFLSFSFLLCLLPFLFCFLSAEQCHGTTKERLNWALWNKPLRK